MQANNLQGFRLAPQQKRLWLVQQTSQAYRAQCAILIDGPLDTARLAAALQQLVERHEILRTTFYILPKADLPVQVIAEDLPLRIDEVADQATAQSDRVERFNALLQLPFDYRQGPLVRAWLERAAPQQHRLLLSLPAICADRRSLNQLIDELAALYAADSGTEVLDEPLQYVDAVEWHYEVLENEHSAAGDAYWRNHTDVAGTSIQVSQPVAAQAAFAPLSYTASLSQDCYQRLVEREQQDNLPLTAILFTCWAALIQRLTAADQIAMGVVTEGREHEDLRDAVGPYTKTLPLSLHVSAQSSYDELVRQAVAALSDANAWQAYFNPTSSPAATSLGFQPLSFEFVNWPRPVQQAGVTFSMERQFYCSEPFQLKLLCVQAHDMIDVEWQYDPAQIASEDVVRIAGYFTTLLNGVLHMPQARIDQLPLLDEQAVRELTSTWIGERRPHPADRIEHLFEQQAARTPDSTAVVCMDQQMTYAELNTRANQLAQALRQQGVAGGAAVGLYLERSVELIVGLLGILKAGGSYVPLDLLTPHARLRYQLDQSGAAVLVTHSALAATLSDLPCAMLSIDQRMPSATAEPDNAPARLVSPDAPAYVVYTSGSTGVPKGVVVTHTNLVNYVQAICRRFQLPGGLHFANVSTIASDLGNTAIFPALLTGGCLHIVTHEVATDGRAFAHYVAERSIDVLKIVPSHLQALLGMCDDQRMLPRRYLFLGGEACSNELAGRLLEQAQGCTIVNHYGPTETTVGCLTYTLAAPRASESSSVPIGGPLDNTECYVLDAYMQPVPLGVPGELYIGGLGVAHGYMQQPAETAARFVPNSFALAADAQPGARLYRTGDRVRSLADSALVFLGRIDQQIKIRGFRVEVAEVEAILRQHPALHDAAVLVHYPEQGPSDPQLIAYIVARETPPDSDDLRTFVKAYLPEYMIPTAFVPLDVLPLSANGKVDRRRLVELDRTRRSVGRPYVAPRTPYEEQIAALFAQLLNVERVGVDDHFFELGGHSLLATQLVARLQQAFAVDVPVRLLFDRPTVADLSQAIVQLQIDQTADADVADLLDGLADRGAS